METNTIPLFTIVTATFNAAATVERTFASVARQTERRYEHIVMDGGSHDATVRLAQQYADTQTDVCVTVVSEPDKGLYDAFNKALRRARGEYVVFLNAGDAFHSEMTLAVVARAAEADAEGRRPAVVYGETDLVDAEGKFLAHRRLQVPELLHWRSFAHGMLVCHQSFYALRSCVPEYDLRYRFSADVDWCIRVMRAAETQGLDLVNANEVLTDYLAEGMTTQNHRASLIERFHVMRRHYGLVPTVLRHIGFAIGIR